MLSEPHRMRADDKGNQSLCLSTPSVNHLLSGFHDAMKLHLQ